MDILATDLSNFPNADLYNGVIGGMPNNPNRGYNMLEDSMNPVIMENPIVRRRMVLGNTFHTYASATASEINRTLCPIVRTEDANIAITTIEANPTLVGTAPYLTEGSDIIQKEIYRVFDASRKKIDIEYEMDHSRSAFGQQKMLVALAQLAESLDISVLVDVITQLAMTCKDFNHLRKVHGYTHKSVREILYEQREMFNIVAKEKRGLKKLHTIALSKVLGVTDSVVVDQRTLACSNFKDENNDFYLAGEESRDIRNVGANLGADRVPQNAYGSEIGVVIPEYLKKHAVYPVQALRPHNVPHKFYPTEMCAHIGEFYVMGDLYAARDMYGKFRGRVDRSIAIYNEDTNEFQRISLVEAIENCAIWDNDGKVNRFGNGTKYDFLNLGTGSSKDQLSYNESSIQYIGDMNPKYLPPKLIKEFCESVIAASGFNEARVAELMNTDTKDELKNLINATMFETLEDNIIGNNFTEQILDGESNKGNILPIETALGNLFSEVMQSKVTGEEIYNQYASNLEPERRSPENVLEHFLNENDHLGEEWSNQARNQVADAMKATQTVGSKVGSFFDLPSVKKTNQQSSSSSTSQRVKNTETSNFDGPVQNVGYGFATDDPGRFSRGNRDSDRYRNMDNNFINWYKAYGINSKLYLVIGDMFLATAFTKKNMIAFAKKGLLVPANFIIWRFMSYQTTFTVHAAGRGKSCVTLMAQTFWDQSTDASIKKGIISYSYKSNSVVTNPNNVLVTPNAHVVKCNGGGGCEWWTPAEFKSNNYNLLKLGRDAPSLFCTIIPHTEVPKDDLLDMRGNDLDGKGMHSSRRRRRNGQTRPDCTYNTCARYSDLYELGSYLENIESLVTMDANYTRNARITTFAFKGPYYINNPDGSGFNIRVFGKGHHGPYVYEGVRSVRNGGTSGIEPSRMLQQINVDEY